MREDCSARRIQAQISAGLAIAWCFFAIVLLNNGFLVASILFLKLFNVEKNVVESSCFEVSARLRGAWADERASSLPVSDLQRHMKDGKIGSGS